MSELTDFNTVERLLAEHFPKQGPYHPDTTRAAAYLIAELVRYLNHATLNDPEQALLWPSTANGMLQNLRAAAVGSDQLLRQTDARLRGFLNVPGFYLVSADTNHRYVYRPEGGVDDASAALRGAGAALDLVATRLSEAIRVTDGLGLDEHPDPRKT